MPNPKKPTGLKPLRVLIVDDSENEALLLVRELKRGGYEPVYERVDTSEAMEKALANSEWDVIVSDYRMPRFGALDALAMAQEASFEGPSIVVSGKVGEEAAAGVIKSGAYDFLTKGNLALLIPMVERGLEETRERRRRDAILEAVRFAAFPGHLGLRSMRERAERLGGSIAVESAAGMGTKIRAWVPV